MFIFLPYYYFFVTQVVEFRVRETAAGVERPKTRIVDVSVGVGVGIGATDGCEFFVFVLNGAKVLRPASNWLRD